MTSLEGWESLYHVLRIPSLFRGKHLRCLLVSSLYSRIHDKQPSVPRNSRENCRFIFHDPTDRHVTGTCPKSRGSTISNRDSGSTGFSLLEKEKIFGVYFFIKRFYSILVLRMCQYINYVQFLK